MDDVLYDVGQRLDALAADDERAYHHLAALSLSARGTGSSSAGPTATTPPRAGSRRQQQQHQQQPHPHYQLHRPPSQQSSGSALHVGHGPYSRWRWRRRHPLSLSALLGLSGFYLRVVLVLLLGWGLLTYTLLSSTVLSLHRWTHDGGDSVDDSNGRAWVQLARECGATALGAALGSVLLGALADCYGRRRVFLGATLWWILVHMGISLAPLTTTPFAVRQLARGLEGLALGGQVLLLIVLASEIAAQRQRGRMIALSLVGVILGGAAAVYSTVALTDALTSTNNLSKGQRMFHTAVLAPITLAYVVVVGLALQESPRFLAASGRSDAASQALVRIEVAHGIHRHVRVPQPSSLFDPPRAGTTTTPAVTTTTATTPRIDPSSGPSSTTPTGSVPSSTAAARPLSLGRCYRRVLCRAPYRARSLSLVVGWFTIVMALLVAVVSISRWHSTETDVDVLLGATLAAALLGLVTAAKLIDRHGRVTVLCSALVVDAVAVALAAVDAHVQSTGVGLATCVVLGGGMAATLATGCIWTLEHYAVVIRATGLGHALASGWLGLASALWLVWSTSTEPPPSGSGQDRALTPGEAWLALDLSQGGVVIACAISAALLLLVAGLTWTRGGETRGRDDCDMVLGDSDDDQAERAGAAMTALTASGANRGDTALDKDELDPDQATSTVRSNEDMVTSRSRRQLLATSSRGDRDDTALDEDRDDGERGDQATAAKTMDADTGATEPLAASTPPSVRFAALSTSSSATTATTTNMSAPFLDDDWLLTSTSTSTSTSTRSQPASSSSRRPRTSSISTPPVPRVAPSPSSLATAAGGPLATGRVMTRAPPSLLRSQSQGSARYDRARPSSVPAFAQGIVWSEYERERERQRQQWRRESQREIELMAPRRTIRLTYEEPGTTSAMPAVALPRTQSRSAASSASSSRAGARREPERSERSMIVAQREAALQAEHDMITIEIDPFEDFEDSTFVSIGSPTNMVPMLGDR